LFLKERRGAGGGGGVNFKCSVRVDVEVAIFFEEQKGAFEGEECRALKGVRSKKGFLGIEGNFVPALIEINRVCSFGYGVMI
jgi:hypothetical protein